MTHPLDRDPSQALLDLRLPEPVRTCLHPAIELVGVSFDDLIVKDPLCPELTRQVTWIKKNTGTLDKKRFLLFLPGRLLVEASPAHLDALSNLILSFSGWNKEALYLFTDAKQPLALSVRTILKKRWSQVHQGPISLILPADLEQLAGLPPDGQITWTQVMLDIPKLFNFTNWD